MIYRTTDVDVVESAVSPYPELLKGFEVKDWLAEDQNIAITDDSGNVGLLVWNRPGVYCGHYFFKRSPETANRVREMISYAFDTLPIKVLIGVTPSDNKGALRMNRRMGFTSHGVEETTNGPCELVTLTREDFEKAK